MAARQPTVLFVPGAFSGGWIWEDNFASWFAERGWATDTLSFPGHGKRGLLRNRFSLDDYIAALDEKLGQYPAPTFVVAHSLGGLVTLKTLGTGRVRGAALLSPIPPDGILRSVLTMARRSPGNLLKLLAVSLAPGVAQFGSPPQGIYSAGCDRERERRITRQLSTESLRALAGTALPRTIKTCKTPVHFFGAAEDGIIPAKEVARAARAWDAPCKIYPAMGHTFQAERSYARVAEDIEGWFASLEGVQRRAAA